MDPDHTDDHVDVPDIHREVVDNEDDNNVEVGTCVVAGTWDRVVACRVHARVVVDIDNEGVDRLHIQEAWVDTPVPRHCQVVVVEEEDNSIHREVGVQVEDKLL